MGGDGNMFYDRNMMVDYHVLGGGNMMGGNMMGGMGIKPNFFYGYHNRPNNDNEK